MNLSPFDRLAQLTLRLATVVILAASIIVADDRRPIRLSYQVVEQQPPGTFVANVALDAGLAAQLPADTLRHIRFRFLSESQRLLSINALSGVITTADIIDRDSSAICRQMESCEINVDVVLQPVQFFQVSTSSSSHPTKTKDVNQDNARPRQRGNDPVKKPLPIRLWHYCCQCDAFF